MNRGFVIDMSRERYRNFNNNHKNGTNNSKQTPFRSVGNKNQL